MIIPGCPTLRRRSLADAGLAGVAVEEFKRDQRSHVWRVDSERGPFVVKRFVYSPWRQRLSLLVGAHPAQVEVRWNQRLQAGLVAVVPVHDGGIEPSGFGCRVWLSTEVAGTSMQRLIRAPEIRKARGEGLIAAAAGLAAQLFAAGFWSRDFKPSNIVIDDAGGARLIDVGSARRGASARNIARTMAVMDRVLARDGVEPSLRLRFAVRVAETLQQTRNKKKREP